MVESGTVSGMQVEFRQGGCLCGAVRYRVEGALRPVVYCHCRQCRRAHGHHAAYFAADKSAVRIERELSLAWYVSSRAARRGFCGTCGSGLFWEPLERGHLCISAGSLDDDRGLTASRHVFVADKGAYYEPCDGLPRDAGSMYARQDSLSLNVSEGRTDDLNP